MTDFAPPKTAGEQQQEVAESLQAFSRQLASEATEVDPDNLEQLNALLGADAEPHPKEAPPPPDRIPGRLDLDDIEVTEQDKDRYFESVLAMQPFSEEASLFDGRLSVVLRSRSADEAEEATKAANGSVTSDDMVTALDYQAALNKYHMGYGIVSVKTDSWSMTPSGDLASRVRELGSLPAPTYAALLVVMARFNSKAEKLTLLSTLPNFWRPVLDSSS